MFLMHLAVAFAGLAMAFATIPVDQTSGRKGPSDHLRQPQSQWRLDFLRGFRNIDPEIYSPLNRSLDAMGELSIPSTDTLARYIQHRHASAQPLADFATHDLPCALRGLRTGDQEARLRSVLSHGHKLSKRDRTTCATLREWYVTSRPAYYRALKDAETARDRARMSKSQQWLRKHQPIPFFMSFKDAWRTQKSAQAWFDEVSSLFASHEAEQEALIADCDRNENFKTELFNLMVSLDNDPPGPWNCTDDSALKMWYFHMIASFGGWKLERASFEAEFDRLECDPI